MKKTIGKVKYQPTKIEEGIYASPTSFRLEMREFLKQEIKDIYFKKSNKYQPAKNLGCYLFGQPDTWRGIVSIRIDEILNDKTNKAKIEVIVDDFRIQNAELKKEIVDILNNLLEKMHNKCDFVELIKENNQDTIKIKNKNKR